MVTVLLLAGCERVRRRRLDRGEVRAVGAAEDRQRLVAGAPAGGQLQDDAARALGRAEVDLDPLRERVVGALPVGGLVAVGHVARRVHVGVAGLAGRLAGREVGAHRAGTGAGQRDRGRAVRRVAGDRERAGTGAGRGRAEADVDRAGRTGRDRRAAGVRLREVTGDRDARDRGGRGARVGDRHRLRRAGRVERLAREGERGRVGAQGRRGRAAWCHRSGRPRTPRPDRPANRSWR